MKDNLLKIINHYGVLPQLKYFQSEVFELNEAIMTREFDYNTLDSSLCSIKNDEKHILEEIADVLVMLQQFIEYYKIDYSDINEIMRQKIDRQLERIKDEKNEK